jgi:RNA polymerase sigma factor (sigma-70 family)
MKFKMETEQQKKFIEMVNPSKKMIYRICNIYTQNADDWHDLWQDILYQLWKSYPSFSGQCLFSTWMYRVALNTALMLRRKQYRQPHLFIHEEEMHASPELQNQAPDEDVQMLYSCIRELKPVDRAVILLKLEQKSYEEISEITGLSQSNVSVRLVRIKDKLRQLLIQKGYKGEP